MRSTRQKPQCPIDPSQTAFAAEDRQRVEHPQPDALARGGDAQGVDDLAHFDFFGRDELVEACVERRGVERFALGQYFAKLREQVRRVGRFAEPFFECLFVVGELVVGRKEISVGEDVAGDFEPIAGSFDDA